MIQERAAETERARKRAALLAARHATDRRRALQQYASLTGQLARLYAEGEDALEQEMCSFLPAYRHPVHDVATEQRLFFDPEGTAAQADEMCHHRGQWPTEVAWLQQEWAQSLHFLAELTSTSAVADLSPEGMTARIARFRAMHAYRLYVYLVRSAGRHRETALRTVQECFAFTDSEETLQALRQEQGQVIRLWQKSAPCLAETVLERWRGLLPPG